MIADGEIPIALLEDYDYSSTQEEGNLENIPSYFYGGNDRIWECLGERELATVYIYTLFQGSRNSGYT